MVVFMKKVCYKNNKRCFFRENKEGATKISKTLSGLTAISFSQRLGEGVKVKYFWSDIDSWESTVQ